MRGLVGGAHYHDRVRPDRDSAGSFASGVVGRRYDIGLPAVLLRVAERDLRHLRSVLDLEGTCAQAERSGKSAARKWKGVAGGARDDLSRFFLPSKRAKVAT